MNFDEFRGHIESFRRTVEEEGTLRKDSYYCLDKLYKFYKQLDDEERKMADKVLSEWVLSDHENIRFEAMAMIREFKVVTTSEALRKQAVELRFSRSPGAPYEIIKIQSIFQSFNEK